MERILRPEILDYLPPENPAARGSRRDLRWINRLMGNHRWLRRTGSRLVRSGERLLELGAGDGRWARDWRAMACDALDTQAPPAGWPADRAWHQVDVRDFRGWDRYGVVFANLFFHHLSEPVLRQVGEALRRHVRVIIACEPLRARRVQWLFAALCPVIGANGVTRHDGRVSIAAGFRGDELARHLGLCGDEAWEFEVQHTALGAYRLVAFRR